MENWKRRVCNIEYASAHWLMNLTRMMVSFKYAA
jgi:hypothetical protein